MTGGRVDRRALWRVVASALPGAEVVAVRRLAGGLSTTAHVVRIEHGGRRRSLVLRQHTGPDAPATAAATEWAGVRLAYSAGLPAPEPLWHDSGDAFGVPAVLLAHVPGRLDLDAVLSDDGIDALVGVLAALHAIDPTGSGLGRDEEWLARERPADPPDDWRGFRAGGEAWELYRTTVPSLRDDPVVPCHADFHAGNTIWSRRRLQGVIDWESATLDSPGLDVPYLQLDLTLVAGPDAGDHALERYERWSAPVRRLAFWQVLAAGRALGAYRDWANFYRRSYGVDVSDDEVRRRLEEFLGRAVRSA